MPEQPEPEPEPELEPEPEPEQRAPEQLELAQGADPNSPVEFDRGWAPLCLAAIKGHVEVVDVLAGAGADLSWKNPGHYMYGSTALQWAADYGRRRNLVNRHPSFDPLADQAVRALAAHGGHAAVDARDNRDETPLHHAAMNSHVVLALLAAGADAATAAWRWRWLGDAEMRTGYSNVTALTS